MPDQRGKAGYCGCCGREFEFGDYGVWCASCAQHVLQTTVHSTPYYEMTYFAQFGEECPYVNK